MSDRQKKKKKEAAVDSKQVRRKEMKIEPAEKETRTAMEAAFKRTVSPRAPNDKADTAKDGLTITTEQLRRLSARIEDIREEESKRIARKIHDELGQTLVALQMQFSWLLEQLPQSQEPLMEKGKRMLEMIDEALTVVERITSELRPRILDELGLEEALEWYANEFQGTRDIHCNVDVQLNGIHLDAKRSTLIFRIVQEALTNVIRHARAETVEIRLQEHNGELQLTVKDDGRGITEEEIFGQNSFGIMGIKERAYILDGEIRIKGEPGEGTVLTLTVPLNPEEESL